MSHLYKRLTNNTFLRTRRLHPWCYWNNAFTQDELDTICDICTSKPLDTGQTAQNFNNTIIPISDIRKSFINFHDPNEETGWIFERLNFVIEQINSDFYNFDLNGYNMFQYTEYRDSDEGRYGWHMDTFIGDFPTTQYEQRKLSLTLLLNEPGKDFEGGDFQFDFFPENGPTTIECERGGIILFPSFLTHQVTKITKGVRKSLVVWVLGPHFR